MKHQVSLYNILGYHRGPLVQILCALDFFWVQNQGFFEVVLFSSSSSIHCHFLMLSWASAVKFMKLYASSNPSWCAVLMLHSIICDFWWTSSAPIMSDDNTRLDKAPIHQNPNSNFYKFMCLFFILHHITKIFLAFQLNFTGFSVKFKILLI